MFMWRSMLVEGNEMSIEIHKKRTQRRKILTRELGSEEGSMFKANIKFFNKIKKPLIELAVIRLKELNTDKEACEEVVQQTGTAALSMQVSTFQ